jgi:rod shape-determining protein MreD
MPISKLMSTSKTSWLLSGLITLGSLLFCVLALPTRFPGMTLMGIGPNWLLIWLVAWSLNRPVLIAAIAGAGLGLLQDALTLSGDMQISPTHAIGMAIAGGVTALLQKQRYIQEDFISVALIVFGMAVVVETAIALQLTLIGRDIGIVWTMQQRIALGSAILSSLWSPVLHFPLSRWWRHLDKLED